MSADSTRPVRRVLMTADTVGGVWTYAVDLVSELNKRGVEVALATMGPLPDRAQRQRVASMRNVELFESSYKLEWMEEPWEEVEEAGEWILELEILTHPDIVHLNSFVHGSLPWHAPVVITGHSCVYSWYEYVKKCEPPVTWEYYRSRVAEGLRSADFVVAPSLSMFRALQRHYGVSVSGGVIYNGRSAEGFAPSCKEPFLFTAGRVWDQGKNIGLLEKCTPHLQWPLLVAGDCGSYDMGAPNMELLGKISSAEIARYMSRASIFVLPSRYEPFGLSVLEAAISGCALVLGDIDSLREIWEDGALYVPSDDADSITGTLRELISHPSLRAQYAERAQERASQFTLNRMAEEYFRLYRKLALKKTHGRVECRDNLIAHMEV